MKQENVAVAVLLVASICLAYGVYRQRSAVGSKSGSGRPPSAPDESESTADDNLQPRAEKSSSVANLTNLSPLADDVARAKLSQEESRLGSKAFKNSSYTLAVEHFTRALELCPQEDVGSRKVLLNNRAAAHERLEDWDIVVQDSTAALDIDRSYKRALLRRALALEKLGRLTEALVDLASWKLQEDANVTDEEKVRIGEQIERLAKSIANSKVDNVWNAQVSHRAQNFTYPRAGTAREYYYTFSSDARNMRSPPSEMAVKDAIERLDQESDAYGNDLLQVATMFKYRVELVEAHSYWQKVRLEQKASPATKGSALAEIASLHHMSGDVKTAKSLLEESLLMQVNSRVLIKLAAIAVEEGFLKDAKEHLEKAMASVSISESAKADRADVNFHKSAVISLEATDLSEARELLDSAIADVPDFGLAHMQLGVTLFRMGLIDESLKALETACLLIPEVAEVHNFRGEVLMSLDRRDDALACFDEAICADEACALPLLNKGVMCLTKDQSAQPTESDLQNALDHFSKAVQVDPENDMAYIHRASYFTQIGDFATALHEYETAIKVTKAKICMEDYIAFSAVCTANLTAERRYRE